jgi:integrase
MHKGGLDPLAEKQAATARAAAEAQNQKARMVTFRAVAETYMGANEAGWKNPKHRRQWSATLQSYVYPHMGSLPVAEIDTPHVLAALEPIWRSKPETASRVRGRIEVILDYARARKWRDGENPARWRGHLAQLLPARVKVAAVEHHAALPWREIGAFMVRLAEVDGMGALALRYAILTAARTGEVIGATWGEVDIRAGVWTIAAARMKAGREHRVPLTNATLAILADLARLRTTDDPAAPVFPGAKGARGLSNMSLLMTLRRMKRTDLTVHGFRSTFRDWAAETTGYPAEVVEMALAHAVGDKVEAAYRRGDLFQKRRRLMGEWATFCARLVPAAGDLVPLRAAS